MGRQGKTDVRPLRQQVKPVDKKQYAHKEVKRRYIPHERHRPLPKIERAEHDHGYQQQEEEAQQCKLEQRRKAQQEAGIIDQLPGLRGLCEAKHQVYRTQQRPDDQQRFIEIAEGRVDGSKQQVHICRHISIARKQLVPRSNAFEIQRLDEVDNNGQQRIGKYRMPEYVKQATNDIVIYKMTCNHARFGRVQQHWHFH